MKKNLFLLLTIVLLSYCTEKTNSLKAQVPSGDLMSLVYAECENPDIIEIEHAEDNYTEIEYFCNGKRYDMGIKDSKIMFIETSVKRTEIPIEKIKQQLSKDYQNWSIDEASEVRTATDSFYKIELVKDGIEQNLYFTKEGKWYKFNSLEVSDQWDLSTYSQNELYTNSGYNFFKPTKTYEMPSLLREISGIALKDAETMYCVQDELGAIFEFNMEKTVITQLHRFSDIGDFEDLTIANNSLLILRSDGLLFSYDTKNKQTKESTMLALNSLDIEGLCHWNNELYLASKAAQINQDKDKRSIFKIDKTKLHKPEIYLEIDIVAIRNYIAAKYKGLNASDIQFNPSALAFHPKTGALYILSASDRLLTIYKDKKLQQVILLPATTYYKPEGLSFAPNGNLYISNEGDKKGFIKGSIMLFEYSH